MSFSNPQEMGKPITIKDEGVPLTTNVGSIDFAGAGVTATNVGAAVTSTIPGGSSGTGTVTDLSVVSANGFAGTVATSTTTPAITLTTSITGVVKGNGTALSAATAGSDYTTPSSTETVTNKNLTSGTNTFPTFNQNTTGSAAKWTTARLIAGNSVDGSAAVTFANKFIVQGTTDTGLSAAQFLGALGTGIVKNTTTTGVLSIAVAGDFPTLNQDTTGSAAKLTTARTLFGSTAFDGTANITDIIGSAFGGTGNGFTKFSGPASTEKTFTLPNANATIARTDAGQTFTGTQAFASNITVGSSADFAGSVSGTSKIQAASSGGGTSTLPAGSDTLAGIASTQTLTNKTIQGAAITGALTGTGAYIPVTLLNSGTSASSSTFWRGDGTWSAPSGSGDMVLASVQTVTGAKTFNAGKLIDKGEIVFDVKGYGATGDGTTDDTAAIQSAVDACNTAGGGTVWFPKGTYKLVTNPIKLYSGTTPTIVAYSNITLAGAGSNGITGAILTQTTTGVDVIKGLNDVANGAQALNIVIRDLTVAWGTATLTNSGNGIYLAQQGAGGPSFQQWDIRNVQAANFQGSGKYGFNFESMITSTVQNCNANACANGFLWNGASGGAFNSVSTSVVVSNCYANMATNGVVGYKCIDNTYMTFIGCACDIGVNSAGPGYLIDSSNSISLVSCGVELSGTVTLSDAFKFNAASQCGMYNCYIFQPKSTRGVYLTGTSVGITLIGTQINSNISGTTGLTVDAGSQCTEIDNDFSTANTVRTINATGVDIILNDTATGSATLKTLNVTTALLPTVSGTPSVGSTTKMWANFFLASGGVINFNNGNYTITHSAGLLTTNGALSIGTGNAFTAGTIELGAATDTTLSRSAAGVLAVEGVVIPSISSTNTITNKRNTLRTATTAGPGATPSINTDNLDYAEFTALTAAITSMTTNLTGTPVRGDKLWISFTDNGTARAITWGASFEASTVALPTTTVISTRLDVGFTWNVATSKWRCVAVA